MSDLWAWIGSHDVSRARARHLFGDAQIACVPSVMEQTADELNDLLRTLSFYSRLSPAQRQAIEGGHAKMYERLGRPIRSSTSPSSSPRDAVARSTGAGRQIRRGLRRRPRAPLKIESLKKPERMPMSDYASSVESTLAADAGDPSMGRLSVYILVVAVLAIAASGCGTEDRTSPATTTTVAGLPTARPQAIEPAAGVQAAAAADAGSPVVGDPNAHARSLAEVKRELKELNLCGGVTNAADARADRGIVGTGLRRRSGHEPNRGAASGAHGAAQRARAQRCA